MEPDFDAILTKANQGWSFLFKTDNRIVATDIFGLNDRGVLDIVSATNNVNSELLYDHSISTDGSLLAVIYFNERDTSGYWHPPIGKLILVDLQNGAVKDIPTSLADFAFDWTAPVYWLSPTIFLVKMHRYVGEDIFSEQVTFQRYDLRDISAFQKIAFDPCSLTTVTEHKSHALLLASDCEPLNDRVIFAIDIQGLRLATTEETADFSYFDVNCRGEASCVQEQSVGTVPNVKIERVVGDALDGFDRFYEHNWNRYYIYAND